MRRGFKLAIEKGLLAVMPLIKLPKVENARQGFFEDGDFALVLAELPAYLRSLVRFLRLTGWRVSEGVALLWEQVDFDGKSFDSGQTKLRRLTRAVTRLA